MDAILAALDALSEVKKAQPAPAQAAPPAPEAARPATAPPRAPRKAEPPAPAPKAGRAAGALQGMFEDGNTLLRAVIAAEVLGPPASLKEHHFWNPPSNEPST